MILTEKLYRMQCAIERRIMPPLIIHARTMDEADAELMLHWSSEADGKEIRILSARELDLDSL